MVSAYYVTHYTLSPAEILVHRHIDVGYVALTVTGSGKFSAQSFAAFEQQNGHSRLSQLGGKATTGRASAYDSHIVSPHIASLKDVSAGHVQHFARDI